MRWFSGIILAFCPLFLVWQAAAESAVTLKDLIAQQKLEIRSWVEPEDEIVVSQRVQLKIEISTKKWFLGGTRIGRLEIRDAIVMQSQGLATNFTRRIGVDTWSAQEWTINIFPQQEGSFDVPALPINLSVAGPNNKPVTGTVTTKPLQFQAIVPAELKGRKGWVATTQYDVDQSFDKPLDELKPGDALRRTIRFRAEDIAAMMLPEVITENLDGLRVYRKSPQVRDDTNRGALVGERTETLTYMVERPGTFILPELSFYWWNLESGTVEIIQLPERNITTMGANIKDQPLNAIQTEAIDNPSINWGVYLNGLLYFVLTGLLAFALVQLVLRVRFKRTEAGSKPLSEKKLRALFLKACQKDSPEKAIAALYRWLDRNAKPPYQGSLRNFLKKQVAQPERDKFNQTMIGIYSASPKEKPSIKQLGNQVINMIRKQDQIGETSQLVEGLRLN